jgi:hypothetical protein
MVAPGVINYPLKRLGLCASITHAPYKTTTEVYPDSPRATPEQCNAAQVAAVCAAIDFALAHPLPTSVAGLWRKKATTGATGRQAGRVAKLNCSFQV